MVRHYKMGAARLWLFSFWGGEEVVLICCFCVRFSLPSREALEMRSFADGGDTYIIVVVRFSKGENISVVSGLCCQQCSLTRLDWLALPISSSNDSLLLDGVLAS